MITLFVTSKDLKKFKAIQIVTCSIIVPDCEQKQEPT